MWCVWRWSLIQSKKMESQDLAEMVRFGAQLVFQSGGTNITDADIVSAQHVLYPAASQLTPL